MSATTLQSELVAPERDEMADFCQFVVSRHSKQWPVKEDALAKEFLEFFGVQSLLFLTFEAVASLCWERLQIRVSRVSLPKGLKGFNGSYYGRREIVISTDQDLAGIADLHTLLHELREIIERGFEELGHPTADCGDLDLECRAEFFASSVQISFLPQQLASRFL